MSKCKINIWNRVFEISVVYECYPGEEVLESQKEAFSMLTDSADEIAESLDAVKKYVRESSSDHFTADTIENIFKYVMPKSIFVPHVEKKRIAAIMCNYKFNMEHGIAVVFEAGKFMEVSTQDTVL